MPAHDVSLVLAHGAWADGSCWAPIVAPLSAEGYKVVAAPLPLTSFADDVATLDRTIARVGGDVIVVGHAYAGAVIGATRSERARALVYVAALAPDEGESVADVFYRAPPHPLAPQLAPDDAGWVYLPDDAFANAFAPNASAAEQAVLRAAQRPLAAACIGVKMTRPLWKDRPSWYFVAEEDRMIPGDTQRFMAERMGARRRAHPVDHAPMLTAPPLVLDIVRDAIGHVAAA